MARTPDVRSAGRSSIVPFIYGETKEHRHERRMLAAGDTNEKMRAGCAEIGVSVAGDERHYRFSGAVRAEWWPSTAKLVFDRRYDRGIHCHDYRQLIAEFKRRMYPSRKEAAMGRAG